MEVGRIAMDYKPHGIPYTDAEGNLRVKRRHGVEREMCLATEVRTMTAEQFEAHRQAAIAAAAAEVAATGIDQPVPDIPMSSLNVSYFWGTLGGVSAWLIAPAYELIEAWPPPADPEPEPEG